MGTADEAIAKLEYAIRVLDRIGDLPRQLAVAAAPEITKLQKAQFTNGTDPYGRPWQPLAESTLKKGRTEPPLTDTKALRDGTDTVPVVGGRIALSHRVAAPYGIYHDSPRPRSSNLPRRMILPSEGLPKAWSDVLDTQANILAQRAVGT